MSVHVAAFVIPALLAWLSNTPVTKGADRDGDQEGAAPVTFSPEAAAIFNTRCTTCHTYGKGIKVGPDLKGVNDRRTRDWLLKFIHASSAVIKSGDPTALALFAEFKQQRMPDWVDLSDRQLTDVLEYLAVGGPDIKPADERHARTATAAEEETGRQLFFGEVGAAYGARACVTCHGVIGAGWHGGALGPDLSDAYARYQDLALTEFLRHPCFTGDTQATEGRYLTPRESFALKAFLREAGLRQHAPEGRDAGERSKKEPVNDGT